ncbi:hypothetical protein Tco_0132526 [Tanacetum coccineum]
MPRDCLRIIESKSKVYNSRNKLVVAKVSSSTSTPDVSSDVAELKDMVKALLLDKKSPTLHSRESIEKVVLLVVVLIRNRNCPATMAKFNRDNYSRVTVLSRSRRKLTTTNEILYSSPIAKQHSKPSISSVKPVTKDNWLPTNNGSIKDVQPPVIQDQPHVPNSEPVVAPVSALMPNLKPTIPYPSRRREKANDQIEKFYEIFNDLSFEISLTDALILMPKFASTLKALIGNKEKLSEIDQKLLE